jgi:hypothetical protein
MDAIFHIIVQRKGFNTVYDYPYGVGCSINSGVYSVTYYQAAGSTTTITATYDSNDYLVYVVPMEE